MVTKTDVFSYARWVVGCIVLPLLFASAANAQSYTQQTGGSNPMNGEDVGSESVPFLVDIDNDGDLDMFIGEQDGTVNYYENTGSASSATYTQQTGGSNPLNGVDVGSYSHPAFVDIDNDGDFDVYISNDATSISFYENTGSAASPTFSSQSSALSPASGTGESRSFLVDIDNDGDYDAFIGGDDGTIDYFENTGNASSPSFTQQTGGSNPFNGEDIGSYSSIIFVDTDADSDFDAYLGESNGTIVFYENTGSQASPTFTQQTGGDNPFNGVDIGSFSRPTCGDLDNDGDTDCFIGENDGTINYFLNEVTASASIVFTEQTGSDNPFNGEDLGDYSKPTFVDIDNDGDFDMFAGELAGDFIYYENTGSASSPTFTERTGGSNPMNGEDVGDYSAPTAVDLDNDSDYELMVGELFGSGYYFNNTGSAASPTFSELTGGPNPLNGASVTFRFVPVFIDIDNDGDLDAFIGRNSGAIDYYENTGSAASATFTQRTGASNPMDGEDVGQNSTPSFQDLDGDSDYDLVIGDIDGTISYYENTGSAASATFTQRTSSNNPFNGVDVGANSAPALVDIDNDGDFDAFIGEQDGIINYYENQTPIAITTGPGGVTSNLAMWFKADADVYSDDSCTTALTSSDNADALGCWEDQSTNALSTTQSTSSRRPDYNTSGQNYNPTFSFDETEDDRLDFGSFSISSPTDIHAYYVIDENDSDGDDYIIGSTVGSSNRFYLRTTTAGFGPAPSTNATAASDFYLVTADYDLGTTTMNFSIDAGTPISESQSWLNALSSPYRIGAYGSTDGRNSHQLNGDIAEIIVYDADHSGGSDEEKIQSYLGIKWGIHLPISYLASDGTTLWDATTNASYHNDVAGIGRDDDSELSQKQSTSESGGIVEIGLGTLATDNATNANSFTADVSYLIWGHDNASSSVATAFSGTNVFTRMARIWTVEETGTLGTVEVQIPDSYGATYLIVSSNSSLTSPTEYALTDNGDGTMSTTVDFSDGQFFSFGVGAAPGGINASLSLWLKADAGGYTDDSCSTAITSSDNANAVACWEDQSGNNFAPTQSTSSFRPDYSSSGVNYNPTFVFDESEDDYLQFTSAPISSATDVHAYYVIDDDDSDGGGNIYANNGPNNGRTYLLSNTASFGDNASVTETKPSGYYLVTTEYDVSTTTMYFNVDAGTNISESLTFSVTPAGPYRVGAYGGGVGTNSWHYNGELAELIIYTADHAGGSDEQKIQSYLSIKYGIHLPIDLLSTDGTTLWDATSNATYHNDVAGIGRDDASGLNQKQSSSESGNIVEVALGSLATDNATNANSFSANTSFLVWGHDNGSSSVATAYSGTLTTTRMARIWKVEETGTVGSVEVQLPDSYGATFLIVSSNSSLTSPTEYLLTDNGDGTMSTTVDFSDGEFFSFGTGASPGGVSGDLELWLKADADVTLSSGNVSTWNDQSGNNNHATAGGGAVAQNTTAINYNPSLDWDNTADYLSGTSNLGMDNDNTLSMFFVLIDNGSNDYSEVFSLSTYDDEHRLEDGGSFGSWTLFDNTFTSNLALNASATPADRTSWSVISSIYTGTQYSAYLNGTVGSTLSFTQGIDTDAGSTYSIGFAHNGSAQGSAIFELAELIVYSDDVSSNQSQIESYLAIKYGITTSSNYVASDATTLWNATTNSTYHNDVAGIGRDDASGLNQKQSDSDIISLALGSLAADNASNSNTFSSDLSFLILGHDNGSLTESSATVNSVASQLLGRTWLAEETSESGTLEVQFDLSGVSATGTQAQNFQLVLDTDTDPTNGYRVLTQASTFASDIATFTSVDIEDGDYVMILTDYAAGATDPPLTDSQAADGVLGQADFDSQAANNGGISSSRFNSPSYVAVGPTGKLFVSDTENNRILRWTSANAASDGSAAEAVLGQADFTSSSANRGSTVAANTLYEPNGMYVTSSGALYVADTRNNRILRFDNAESASDGADADAVLGQADFTSNDPNRRRNPAANSLRSPMDVYVDASGNLWASDWLNHRVLRYDNVAAKADGADADGVLGQESFTTNLRIWKDGNTDADSFVYPSGVAVGSDGALWVADTGNSRVLRFDNASSKADGADADGVLGQTDFTSWKANRGGRPAANTFQWPDAGIDIDNNGRLWVADRWADRVVWFHNASSKADGADADGIIGQSSFTSQHGSVDNDSFNSANDVLVDESNDYVWIVDNNHHRVLRFDGSDTALGKRKESNLANMLDFWLIANQDVYGDLNAKQSALHNTPVLVWLDQSRHQFTALADTPPVFIEEAINGYPAIQFGARGSMRIEGGIFGETSLDRATVWTIIADLAGLAESDAFSLKIQDHRSNNDSPPGQQDPSQASSSGTNLQLGKIAMTSGTIAELLATFGTPSDHEYNMIGTYLAIKYGLPVEHNYLSAIGDTLWDQELLAAYSTGIAGIGRQDAIGLMHTTSKATGEQHVLTIHKPTPPSDSLASTNAFAFNNSFTLWGHDGKSLAIDIPTNLTEAAFQMQRTWYIQETGDVDSLQFILPAQTRAEYLLVDVSEAFSSPQIIPLKHESTADYVSAFFDINQSAYVTFAAATPYDGFGAPPSEFALYQNYPNPFNPTTTIRFDLPEDTHAYMDIYDILGRRVRILLDEEMAAGTHSLTFDATGLASGVYFYRMKIKDEVKTQKMLLAK